MKLNPSERLYVNGALIENGERRNLLRLLMAETELLRERDVIVDPDMSDPLIAACAIAQAAMMSRDTRGHNLERLRVHFSALLRNPKYRESEEVVAAAQLFSCGRLSAAHHKLLRYIRRSSCEVKTVACNDIATERPGDSSGQARWE